MVGVSNLYGTVSDYKGLDFGGGENKHDLMQMLNAVNRLHYVGPNQTLAIYSLVVPTFMGSRELYRRINCGSLPFAKHFRRQDG